MRIAPVAFLLMASWVVPASGQSPKFAGASIHPNEQSEVDRGEAPNVIGGPGSADPGRITYSRMPLAGLISIAFGMRGDRIIGTQPGLRNPYNITATVEPGSPKKDVPAMLRALLEERFELKTHVEQRTTGFYRIVIAKGGIKFSESHPVSSDDPPPPAGAPDKEGFPILPPSYHGIVARASNGRLLLRGQYATVKDLLWWLEPGLGRAAVDGTGLQGKYDFKLLFRSDPSLTSQNDNDPGDTVFDALSLLGLRPETTADLTDFVVIDSVRSEPVPN